MNAYRRSVGALKLLFTYISSSDALVSLLELKAIPFSDRIVLSAFEKIPSFLTGAGNFPSQRPKTKAYLGFAVRSILADPIVTSSMDVGIVFISVLSKTDFSKVISSSTVAFSSFRASPISARAFIIIPFY